MCKEAKRCMRKGACEMLRRRNNLNRTFASAKPDTSHFAYFKVRNRTFRISHISQVRTRTLRMFGGAKPDISHFAHFAGAKPDTSHFRRCETGHSAGFAPGHSLRVSGCVSLSDNPSKKTKPHDKPKMNERRKLENAPKKP